MSQFLTPLEAQTVEQDREHLEVVVLLIAHHVDHLVDGIVLEAHFGSTDILCHIDGGAVRAQQQLLVETLVSEVGPYTVVLVAFKESLGESFFHLGLTLQVGLALIIYLVELYAHFLVGLVETCIYPVVHLLPQGTHLRVVLFPFHQHLVSLLDERSLLFGLLLIHALSYEFFDFLTILLVEEHVVVSDEVITLLAATFWCLTVAPLQPGQH